MRFFAWLFNKKKLPMSELLKPKKKLFVGVAWGWIGNEAYIDAIGFIGENMDEAVGFALRIFKEAHPECCGLVETKLLEQNPQIIAMIKEQC